MSPTFSPIMYTNVIVLLIILSSLFCECTRYQGLLRAF